MSLRLLHFRSAVLVALLASYFPVSHSLAADPAPAAQSDSTAKTDASSDSGLDFKHSTLSDLMRRFPSKPELGNFGSQDSAPLPPLPPPRAPSARARQLLDEKKNWVFLTPDDVLNDYLIRENLKMPEYDSLGREKTSTPIVERFYEHLSDSHFSTNSAPDFSFNTDNNANPLLSGISAELQNPAAPGNTLATVLNNFNSMVMRPGGVSDLLGGKNNQPAPVSPQEFREHTAQQRHLDAFAQAMNYQPFQTPSLFPTPGATIKPSSSTPSDRTVPGWDDNSDSAQLRNPYDPSAGTYNPLLSIGIPKAPGAPERPTAPARPNIYDKP
ncbi:MAG TPA: hypothetical protein VFM25_02880, partial [Verrucomicrobiae bacterium]|nr:hypothetical protein [Verrucomicrobiae bacterium]